VNWWWELLLLLKNCESLVNCGNLMKWCFNLKFYASLNVFSCIWPVTIFGTSFWHSTDQTLGLRVKRVWNPKFFDRTDERSLERAPSEQTQEVLDTGRLSEPQASFKRANLEAFGSWSLKRAAPCWAIIRFLFRTLGD